MLVPLTDALNVADWPAPTAAEPGATVTAIGCRDTVALADLVESATLVAVIVTVCWAAISVGA